MTSANCVTTRSRWQTVGFVAVLSLLSTAAAAYEIAPASDVAEPGIALAWRAPTTP